ncbi:MAG: SemiSWEET transporter [Chloroflexaceae bacterium]|nr:SemiSWEET transporter [Chloroflexaceae bacterium]
MEFKTLLGLIAGTLTTLSFVPQVLKTWKTRSTKDISLTMFSLFCTGVLLWIIYGISTQDAPVVIANSATLLLASTILWFKLSAIRQPHR